MTSFLSKFIFKYINYPCFSTNSPNKTAVSSFSLLSNRSSSRNSKFVISLIPCINNSIHLSSSLQCPNIIDNFFSPFYFASPSFKYYIFLTSILFFPKSRYKISNIYYLLTNMVPKPSKQPSLKS